MAYKHQDYKVYQEQDSYGKTLWRVRSGGKKGDIATSANTKESAESQADSLNQDPWFLDRGQRRQDRV